MKIWYQSYVDAEHGETYWEYLRAHLEYIKDDDTEFDIKGITPHDSFAHPIVEFRCAREMICNAVQAEREGYDAFVVGHFQDAGLYEARSVVDIPVVGLGESSLLYACQLGQRSGIITINPRYISWLRHQITKYGLTDRVTGVHAMTFQPGQIMDAFGSDEKLQKVVDLFEAQAAPLVTQGADVLIPGGGIPMLLFSALQQHTVTGAPVLNGIPIAMKMAEIAVKLKRTTGLGVSRTSDYVQPPSDVLEEFLTHPKGL